jgi:hypothetical protein
MAPQVLNRHCSVGMGVCIVPITPDPCSSAMFLQRGWKKVAKPKYLAVCPSLDPVSVQAVYCGDALLC